MPSVLLPAPLDTIIAKLNQKHSITAHEVRDEIQCVAGLPVTRKYDEKRGLRWYAEVWIRQERYVVVLRANPWENERYKLLTCYNCDDGAHY